MYETKSREWINEIEGDVAEKITRYNGGLFGCSWKPDFLQVDNVGMPVSGVKENIAVLEEYMWGDWGELCLLLIEFRTNDNRNCFLH